MDKEWLAVDTHPNSPCYGYIYFSYTMFTGVAGAYPIVFSRSSDGGLMFGSGTAAFHGDYIELDADWDGANHIVYVAWADNRDVPGDQNDLDPAPGPPSNNIGNRNQNVYGDRLVVAP